MGMKVSRRPIFPAHLPEENLMSTMRIANRSLVEDTAENNCDGFLNPWPSCREIEDCFDSGRDRSDGFGEQESVSSDINELLPSDPFGMDITTFTAITGWLEDLEMGYEEYGKHEAGPSDESSQLFAGLNFFWNNAMKFQTFPERMGFNYETGCQDSCGGKLKEESCHGDFLSACDVFSVENENNNWVGQSDGFPVTNELCNDSEPGAPHPAISFALGHLGVKDLLIVQETCRSLRCTVRDDALLWRNIHIEQPLNEKITDDALVWLTSKANGTLECLTLVDCPKVTDEGLRRVLESNPRVSKLAVPGCKKISIEGILNCLKALKLSGSLSLKRLRIGWFFRDDFTQQQFEELKSLLPADDKSLRNVRKRHIYYGYGFNYISFDDDWAIDVDICPKCHYLRQVFDCPAEECNVDGNGAQSCRACIICISRCIECGRCIIDHHYEETFCLDKQCLHCWRDELGTNPVRTESG